MKYIYTAFPDRACVSPQRNCSIIDAELSGKGILLSGKLIETQGKCNQGLLRNNSSLKDKYKFTSGQIQVQI